MDVRQVVRTVRANWIVALVTFLACLFIGGAYAVLPTKVYQASVVLLAQPPAGASTRDPMSAPFRSRSPRSRWKRTTPTIDDAGAAPGAGALPDGAGDHLGDR